jgi:hypothetical protein
MLPSLISLAVAFAGVVDLELPATDLRYEWETLDGTVRVVEAPGDVTVTVRGTRREARAVVAGLRSEFGWLHVTVKVRR